MAGTVTDIPSSQMLRYDPSEHRHIKYPTNYWETLIHMVKASIGTGILAMPNAFSKAGYVIGIIGTAVIGILCTYCMKILVKTEFELCVRNEHPMLSYTQTAQYSTKNGPECFKDNRFIGQFANAFVLGFQIGAACIYLIFVSKNIKQVLEFYVHIDMNLKLYFLFVLIPIFLTAMINHFKFLSILSLSANIATMMGFLLIFYYIFQDITNFTEAIKERTAFGHYKDYPLFVGTVVFSMEAIGVVMPLENEMKHPNQFTNTFGVLNVAMIPTVMLYIFVGLTGYVKYGEECAGSITLDLPENEIPAQASKLLLSYGIFCTYILSLFVAYDIIWKSYIEQHMVTEDGSFKAWGMQYLLRVLLIIITCILASVIPNLELFISLVGSLCLATAGIAFPNLFTLCAHWNDNEGKAFVLSVIWYSSIIFIGVIICLIGVTTSLEEIYTTLYAN